jgi:hypothetical protein
MQATCAGECTGTCEGTCEAKLEAAAKCSGTCRGECKVTGAEADCKGSAHAECKAKADASIECKGKCEGEIKPPSASAECEATAKAEASINVQCSPPELAVNYKLKAGVDAMAQARFEAGLKNLARVRLPALVAATARAKVITKAGVDLGQSAEAAVLASVKTLQADGGLRTKITLACAMNELPDVAEAMSDSIDQLEDSLSASAAITGALGMK